jgi:hypothetical protein
MAEQVAIAVPQRRDSRFIQWLMRFKIVKVRREWNVKPGDYDHDFPCDRDVSPPHSVRMRCIDINAPKEAVWPWMGQLRKAPYSYDWIDNLGRKSSPKLTIGADDLQPGQRMIHAMEVVNFEPNEQLTGRMARALWFFGEVATTYRLVDTDFGCRLISKVTVHEPGGIAGLLRRVTHPYGELAMMRKQLITFKKLAEKSVSE